MKLTILAAALISAQVCAQTPLVSPTHAYYGGIVLSDDFRQGSVTAPGGKQTYMHRWEQDVTIGASATFVNHYDQTVCRTTDPSAWCYNQMTYMMGQGTGLANADYMRVEHSGTGPAIARKTAIRGDPNQWGVWAEQINLGRGAKAALWISGDNPEIEGRRADQVPNVIVVNSNLDVSNAVMQWNATSYSSGAFLRMFKDGKVVFEVTRDGIVRAKGFQPIQ